MDGGPLVTLHLWGVGPGGVGAAVLRMGSDRVLLRRTAGLRFWKLLGTGDGRSFTLRDADPLHWGLLAVWDRAADLAAFERSSPVAAGWGRLAREVWRADMLPLRTRGTWAGQKPFSPPQATKRSGSALGAAPAQAGPDAPSGTPPTRGVVERRPQATGWDGPVAAITRARIRPREWRVFWGAVPPVAAAVREAPGLRWSLGIGEAPLGLQGTFSVWDSAAALTAFAYRGAAHARAIAQTGQRRWYAEELFARFAVLQTTGTVDGADPVPAVRRRLLTRT